MVKKNIKYTDYDGNEREEVFYFNLNKAELVELRFSVDGGMDVMLDRIIKSKDQTEIMRTFKKIIMLAYGIKSDDGKRLIKSPEISEAFCQTEAYNQLFMELITDEEKAAEFVNSIIPSDIK